MESIECDDRVPTFYALERVDPVGEEALYTRGIARAMSSRERQSIVTMLLLFDLS